MKLKRKNKKQKPQADDIMLTATLEHEEAEDAETRLLRIFEILLEGGD